MTINKRLKEVRLQAADGEKMLQEEFASKIGLTMSTVSQMERGVKKPTTQTIELVCKTFDINKKWLETGEGPMKKERPPLDEVAMLVSDLLDEGADDPFYQFILGILRTYQRLSPSKRELVQQFVDETLKAQRGE